MPLRLALLALSLIFLAGCGHFRKEAETEAAPAAEVRRPVAAAGETCSGIAGNSVQKGSPASSKRAPAIRRPTPVPARKPRPPAPGS